MIILIAFQLKIRRSTSTLMRSDQFIGIPILLADVSPFDQLKKYWGYRSINISSKSSAFRAFWETGCWV